MKLVDTDADRPEDEAEPAPVVTPPRPEKRRAITSLVFTLAVLGGTVATIYSVFPAPRSHGPSAALAEHRRDEARWQLDAPGEAELRAWTLALLGDDVPVPAPGDGIEVVGARALALGEHPAAFVGYRVGGERVSYLVAAHAHAPSGAGARREGDVVVETWRAGRWTCVGIGPAASADAWRAALGAP